MSATDVIELAARTEPGLRRKLADWYRDLARANRALGFHDLADDNEVSASALSYGGDASLAGADR